jgi:Domain of unknown function (DUF5668)
MNDTPKRPIDTTALFWGLTLVALGTVFLLDRLGMADVHLFFRNLWPLFLILLGVSKLLRRRSVWGGVWFIALGVWLQVSILHLFGMSFNSSWPLLLIALGAGVIVRALTDAARARRLATPTEEHHES